jgi:hypothetical protein
MKHSFTLALAALVLDTTASPLLETRQVSFPLPTHSIPSPNPNTSPVRQRRRPLRPRHLQNRLLAIRPHNLLPHQVHRHHQDARARLGQRRMQHRRTLQFRLAPKHRVLRLPGHCRGRAHGRRDQQCRHHEGRDRLGDQSRGHGRVCERRREQDYGCGVFVRRR